MEKEIDLEEEKLIRELKELAGDRIDSDLRLWPKDLIEAAIKIIKNQ